MKGTTEVMCWFCRRTIRAHVKLPMRITYTDGETDDVRYLCSGCMGLIRQKQVSVPFMYDFDAGCAIERLAYKKMIHKLKKRKLLDELMSGLVEKRLAGELK